MGKKKEIKEEITEKHCNCKNGDKCTCGDNCHCGDDCKCGENCQCGDNCHCGNNKKRYLKVFVISFIGLFLFLGGLIVGAAILYKNYEGIDEKCTKIKEKDYVFTEKHKNYKDITFNDEEELEKFLNRINFLSDEEYRGFFLNTDIVDKDFYYENIVDELKLTYVVSQFLTDETAYLFETEFLMKEIEKVFGDVSSYDSLEYGLSFTSMLGGTTYSIICNDEICFADYTPGGGTGVSRYQSYVYSVTLDLDNTSYLVKEYYYDFDTESVYVEEGGEFLFKGEATEEKLQKVEDKLNTYEITFDKDNKFVSSQRYN